MNIIECGVDKKNKQNSARALERVSDSKKKKFKLNE